MFLQDLSKQVKKIGKTIKLVYTPVHGSGYIPVTTILKKIGISATLVPEQTAPDTEFSTVKVPNPEVKETLERAIKMDDRNLEDEVDRSLLKASMEKLNQLKALAARRNAKLVCVEELRDNRNDEVLSRVYDGTIELKQLLNIKEECIDMTKCEKPIQVIQKIYAAGSEVGTTTTRGQNEYMIDVTTDEGFKAFILF